MTTEDTSAKGAKQTTRDQRVAEAAERALAEAQARRDAQERAEQERAVEFGGRDGPEPTRYGDWEKKGIAIDF